MATSIYEFDTIAISTTGWNAILSNVIQQIEDNLWSKLKYKYGETIAAYKAVYYEAASSAATSATEEGKLYKAIANGGLPCIGLTIEAGVLNDSKRIQRVGEITDPAWTWYPGDLLWVDETTAGELTDIEPSAGGQLMGQAITATTILLFGGIHGQF